MFWLVIGAVVALWFYSRGASTVPPVMGSTEPPAPSPSRSLSESTGTPVPVIRRAPTKASDATIDEQKLSQYAMKTALKELPKIIVRIGQSFQAPAGDVTGSIAEGVVEEEATTVAETFLDDAGSEIILDGLLDEAEEVGIDIAADIATDGTEVIAVSAGETVATETTADVAVAAGASVAYSAATAMTVVGLIYTVVVVCDQLTSIKSRAKQVRSIAEHREFRNEPIRIFQTMTSVVNFHIGLNTLFSDTGYKFGDIMLGICLYLRSWESPGANNFKDPGTGEYVPAIAVQGGALVGWIPDRDVVITQMYLAGLGYQGDGITFAKQEVHDPGEAFRVAVPQWQLCIRSISHTVQRFLPTHAAAWGSISPVLEAPPFDPSVVNVSVDPRCPPTFSVGSYTFVSGQPTIPAVFYNGPGADCVKSAIMADLRADMVAQHNPEPDQAAKSAYDAIYSPTGASWSFGG